MKKAQKKTDEMEIREEYDFSGGVRGKYAQRYAERTNVIILDSEIAEIFPDSKSVNDALKMLAKFVRQTRKMVLKAEEIKSRTDPKKG